MTGAAPRFSAEVQASMGAMVLDVSLEGGRRPAAVVGPNGSGKTTLLRVLAGGQRASGGSLTIGGDTLYDSSRGIDVPIERRRVGYVPQGSGLFPHLSVIDNVLFGLARSDDPGSKTRRRDAAMQLLEELDCAALAARLPRRLSGGERQRVALARALILRPRLLLLDEPLAALDASARRSMRGFLARQLAALDRPSIVVTHDVRDVLALGADVHVLERGRIVQRGSVDDLRARPASDFVAELVGA